MFFQFESVPIQASALLRITVKASTDTLLPRSAVFDSCHFTDPVAYVVLPPALLIKRYTKLFLSHLQVPSAFFGKLQEVVNVSSLLIGKQFNGCRNQFSGIATRFETQISQASRTNIADSQHFDCSAKDPLGGVRAGIKGTCNTQRELCNGNRMTMVIVRNKLL